MTTTYKNTKIDLYLKDGCGRCKYYATPDCKVHNWSKELVLIRSILLDCGLTEELKWSMPCYTFNGKNILMMLAFKDNCCISFFKGSLLQDSKNLLDKAGENTQGARVLRFTNIEQIQNLLADIKAYIFEAIELEKSGAKVITKEVEEYEIPVELINRFNAFPDFEKAFKALTPGRQKAYLLHFNQAKQSKTREAKIDKYFDWIMVGRGFYD